MDALYDGSEIVNKNNGMKVKFHRTGSVSEWDHVICKNIQGASISTFPLSYLLNGNWEIMGGKHKKKKVDKLEDVLVVVEEENPIEENENA